MRFLLIVFGVYIFFAVILNFFQEKYIFFPSKEVFYPPKELNIKDVSLQTVDSKSLHAWWMQVPGAKYTVLFSHGNAGNVSGRIYQMRIFRELGVNALIYDYRGYGKSTGKIQKEEDVYNDIQAAWDYLEKAKNIPPEQIILWGRSLGGAVTTELAQDKSVAAVILESTFFSLGDMARRQFWFMPVRLIQRYYFDTEKKVENIKAPILIVHSKEDEMIPFEQGQMIFEAANDPKSLLTVSGGHNDAFSSGEYLKGVKEFLSKFVLEEKL